MTQSGIQQAIELLGGRYRLLVVRALLDKGAPMRFGALRKEVGEISQKALTSNLRALEACGVVKRTIYAGAPPRVEYELTEAGLELKPVFRAMGEWAQAHLER